MIEVVEITVSDDNDELLSNATVIVRKPEDGNYNDVGTGDNIESNVPINQGGDDNGSLK